MHPYLVRNKQTCSNVLFGILFFAIILGIYRQGLIEVPRSDQYYFIGERMYASSEWDFFVRSLSFSRSRQIFAQTDVLIFRPFSWAILALFDILFREKLLVTGLFSFAAHAAISLLLYSIARRYVGNLYAFLFSLIFIVNLPGSEMFLWRHITPICFAMPSFLSFLIIS